MANNKQQHQMMIWTLLLVIPMCSGNIILRRTENGQFVCPNSPVSLECTVQRTRFLRWRVNSTQLTCLGNANNGTPCFNNGSGVYAIITMVLPDENIANITSLLVINDIGDYVNVSCESQVTKIQEDLRSATAPPPPTGLTVEVNESNVELKWNNASAHHDIDFYRVEVYMIKAGKLMMLHESLEKDTHENVVLYHTIGMLIANVSSYNRCGQMSQGSAIVNFTIQDTLTTNPTRTPATETPATGTPVTEAVNGKQDCTGVQIAGFVIAFAEMTVIIVIVMVVVYWKRNQKWKRHIGETGSRVETDSSDPTDVKTRKRAQAQVVKYKKHEGLLQGDTEPIKKRQKGVPQRYSRILEDDDKPTEDMVVQESNPAKNEELLQEDTEPIKDPGAISHEAAPTGELYTVPDKKKGAKKKKQPQASRPSEEELAGMYSQPDKTRKQQSQGKSQKRVVAKSGENEGLLQGDTEPIKGDEKERLQS